MNRLNNINRLFRVIDNSLFMTTGNLNYDRITDAIISLARAIDNYDSDQYDDESDKLWAIGEYGACGLADLIVGAYWHYSEWHAGQWSKGYAALSALGRIFTPNMSSLDSDSPEFEAYQALESMAA